MMDPRKEGVLRRIWELCLARELPASPVEPKEAFAQLLRGRGPYTTETAYATLAAYRHGAVSLPTEVGAAPEVAGLVSGRALQYFEGMEEQMLRTADEIQRLQVEQRLPQAYCDRKLIGSRREYGRFVRRLARLGLARFTSDPAEEAGIFFDWEKGASADAPHPGLPTQ